MKHKRAAARIAEDVKELANEVATRVRNLPWDFSQLEKRESGLRLQNENRQRKAERDHQEYRDIAGRLIAENPQLRRATCNQLANRVRAELAKQGRGVVSARTIWEALRPKK
jgi:hypothetical protein